MKWQTVIMFVVFVGAVTLLGLKQALDSHAIVAMLSGVGGAMGTANFRATQGTGLTIPPPALPVAATATTVPPNPAPKS